MYVKQAKAHFGSWKGVSNESFQEKSTFLCALGKGKERKKGREKEGKKEEERKKCMRKKLRKKGLPLYCIKEAYDIIGHMFVCNK